MIEIDYCELLLNNLIALSRIRDILDAESDIIARIDAIA